MRLKRTPTRPSYEVTWGRTMQELRQCLDKLTVTDVSIECDAWSRGRDPSRNVSEGYAVTLYYVDDGHPVRITCDKYAYPAGNLRAIYLAMDSRRLNLVRGIDDAVQATYLALPAPAVVRDPYEVLGIRSDSPLAVAEAAFKALARTAHPDTGGSEEAMKELTAAIERVREDRGA